MEYGLGLVTDLLEAVIHCVLEDFAVGLEKTELFGQLGNVFLVFECLAVHHLDELCERLVGVVRLYCA